VRRRHVVGIGLSQSECALVVSKFVDTSPARVGLLQVPLALIAPRRVFERVEDVAGYGWSWVVLLVLMGLTGYATVQTGLIDREAERSLRKSIATLEEQQVDVTQRSVLKEQIEQAREASEFTRLMTRWLVVLVRPLGTLVTIMVLAALVYAVVAMTGRKPEWHTLLTVFVLASFVDLLGDFFRLAMMMRYETLEVDTSLAVLMRLVNPEDFKALMSSSGQEVTGFQAMAPLAMMSGLLTAFDPFRIWFWIVVIKGLSATSQLRGWKVWLMCGLFWMMAAGPRSLMAVGELQASSEASQSSVKVRVN